MQIHLIRHATLIVSLNHLNLLVDPMLNQAEAMEPVANAANQRRIPLVDLPYDAAEMKRLLAQVDAVLITHTHRDHWDLVYDVFNRKSHSLRSGTIVVNPKS